MLRSCHGLDSLSTIHSVPIRHNPLYIQVKTHSAAQAPFFVNSVSPVTANTLLVLLYATEEPGMGSPFNVTALTGLDTPRTVTLARGFRSGYVPRGEAWRELFDATS